MKQLRLNQPTLGALLSLVEAQPGFARSIFRGQTNADWGLVPALFRTTPNIMGGTKESSYNIYEAHEIEHFFNEGMPYLPNMARGFTNDRILAQHFGVPTRLLDWSQDPLVAAFFALEDRRNDCDAAVYMLLPDGGSNINPEHVHSIGPYLAASFRPPAIDRRVPAQKSVFTWHPYGPPDGPFVPLDERPDMGALMQNERSKVRCFAKIVIPAAMRAPLLGRLANIGVDRRNLFPGLDGVGAAVRDWAFNGAIM